MPVPTDELIRLGNTGAPLSYNNGVYNAGTNPYGFDGSGYITNLFNLTGDVTVVTAYAAEQAALVVDLDSELVAVAGAVSDIEAVALIAADISTVADVDAQIAALAPISANITTVAGMAASIATVIANEASIDTVAANIAEILAVEGIAADVAADAASAAASAAAAKRPIFTFEYDSGTGDTDPGTGKFRFNFTVSSATNGQSGLIFIDLTANNGGDATDWLATLDDSTTVNNRGEITFIDQADNSIWVKGYISGANVEPSGYRKLTFTHVAHNGTLVNGHIFTFDWARSGDKGADGLGAGDTVSSETSVVDEDWVVWDSTTGKLIKTAGMGPSDLATVATSGNADDLTEGATKLLLTVAERAKLLAVEASADVTDAGNVGSSIHGATSKTTPVDADTMPLIDSAASNVLKKVTWANIKATIFAALGPLIAAAAGKTTVVGADTILIADSAATNINKSVTLTNLKTFTSPAASDTVAGIIEIATQAEQETGTATDRTVVTGRQHFHKSAAKAWAQITVTGGVPALDDNYNITSLTDVTVGLVTITLATDFSSGEWSTITTVQASGALASTAVSCRVTSKDAGSATVQALSTTAGVDPAGYHFAGYGDI